MNKEYEYSFKVENIEPFIHYCINNDYSLKEEVEQIRTIYKNNSKIFARITKNIKHEETNILDFKEDDLTNNNLKIRKESKELIINDENIEFVKSLLTILDYKETTKLLRKRYVYIKNNVIFEIDKYKNPLMNIISIEGDKNNVDNVYKEIINIKNKEDLK